MVEQHTYRSFRLTRATGLVACVLALGFGCSASDDDAGDGAGEESSAAEEPVRVSARGPAQAAPASPPDAPAADEAAAEDDDAPASDAAESDAEAATEDSVAAPAFASCITGGGAYSDCETIYVTVTQASPARCVQLSIDNCGSYSRQGLSADAPPSWRLASGSVASSASPCELGVFYPGSTSIEDATGSIHWNEETSRPTAIELALTLQPAGAVGETASIAVATVDPLDPVACDD
jgi:hypothetical protein